MKSSLTLLLLFLSVGSLGAQTEKQRADSGRRSEFSVNQGRHTAKLILISRRFVPSAHTIVRTKDCLTIDGRRPIGTDCTVPGLEIASLRLFIDGKEVFIPRTL